MAETKDQAVPPSEWETAVYFTEIPPDSVARHLLLGHNICVKFPEAFIAAYHATEAGVELSAAMATHLNWPSALLKSFNAALSVFSALVESMDPLPYITAAVLSMHKEGIEQKDLQNEVDRFLDGNDTKKLTWYLGISAKKLGEARGDRAGDDEWIIAIVEKLEAAGFLTRNGTTALPKEKNVVWEFKF